MNKTLQLDISPSRTTEAKGERKSVSAQVTTNQQVEPERKSVSASEPDFYQHGATIPADQFDQRKIPICLYCEEQKVGTMRVPRTPEEPAHIALDRYCSDDCEEAHRVEKRQAKDEAHDRMVASWKTTGGSAR